MTGRLRVLSVVFVGLWPAGAAKNRALRALGLDVSPRARIGPSLIVRVERLVLADGAAIGVGNCLRDLRSFEMGESAVLGQWNWVSAAVPFRAVLDTDPDAPVATVSIGRHAAVTSRHYLDASGGIVVGEFATVAGARSTVITHGIDTASAVQTAEAVEIGRYSLVGSNCKIVPGGRVPDRSVIGMGSTVTATLRGEGMLHAGSPARAVREVGDGEYFVRQVGAVEAVRYRRRGSADAGRVRGG